MRKIIVLFGFISITILAQAQIQNLSDSDLEDTNFYVLEDLDSNLNQLVNSWHVNNYTEKINQEGYLDDTPVSDEVYIERLSKLPNLIELPYNNVVGNCIKGYVEGRRRRIVEYMLGIESFYFPMIEESLEKYGLPLELKYLTVVESALNPTAVSRRGASGLWQFMLPTAKNYGLEINSLVDERLDPLKSTDAACRHLKDLFDIYGNWHLAIAAYNCGAGNVNKAIRRANKKTDFWEIYRFLPRETRVYVPLFIAANYVMNYYAYHQLYPVQTLTLPVMDTIMVTQQIHFDQISTVLNISKEEIKALNPQYKRDIIPGNGKPYALSLPSTYAYLFIDKEQDIAGYNTDVLFTNRSVVEDASETAMKGRASKSKKQISGTTKRYKVRSGDSYYTIARKFPGYSSRDLMRLNNTRSSSLRKGQYIRIPNI
jgi:membrane-bound lytic murein transglycosylase D